jgi:hypothetical protein
MTLPKTSFLITREEGVRGKVHRSRAKGTLANGSDYQHFYKAPLDALNLLL